MTTDLPVAEPGTITTFYSYKGGTGRTMALANVACLLGEELETTGQKVCVIDWDLEAPGLHKYFHAPGDSTEFREPGLIDYFTDLRRLVESNPEAYREIQDAGSDALDRLQPLSGYITEDVSAGVDMITAGFGMDRDTKGSDRYVDRVTGFDWAGFYRSFTAVYPALTGLLSLRYSHILIDSRTGLSDVSGVCTMLMPEKLVAVFTPNRQSLEGVLELVEKAVEYRVRSADPRPLAVFPLPGRIPTDEHLLEKHALSAYRAAFQERFRRIYRMKECNLSAYFDEVGIPHKGFYGFHERVAVRDDRSDDSALSVNRAYKRFFRALTGFARAWEFSPSNTVRSADSQDHTRPDEMTTLYASVRSDCSHVFPPEGQTEPPAVVEHLLDEPSLPGGSIAGYSDGNLSWQLFAVDVGNSENAAILLSGVKSLLKETEFISYMTAFFGTLRQPVYVFAMRHYMAGVLGLEKEKADSVAREFSEYLK